MPSWAFKLNDKDYLYRAAIQLIKIIQLIYVKHA